MAGFFGLFNYDKEGPGVSKDAPKKKTFFVFFETFFRNFWKFITINLVYWLFAFPIFTNGLANAGITNIARNTARDKHSFGVSDFVETVKKNWRQALPAGIINAVIFALLIFDLFFFWNMQSKMSVIFIGVAMALLVTFTMMNFYLWTLIIMFKFSLKEAYSISFKLAFINFKYSFLCLFVNVLLAAISIALIFILQKINFFVVLIEMLLLLCVYPAFNALLIQYCTFPCIKKFIIDPYYRANPNEDIEMRRSLGLEIEEPTSKQEAVFDDQLKEEDDGVIFDD